MSGRIIEKKDFDKPISCLECGKQFKNVYDWNYHVQYECGVE